MTDQSEQPVDVVVDVPDLGQTELVADIPAEAPIDETVVCYVDAAGRFIGTWVGPHEPPSGGIVVSSAPMDALREKWNGAGYQAVPLLDDYQKAVEGWLDETVQSHHYKSIESVCTYTASTNAKWRADAIACVAWRDAVWAACYQLLDDVQAGRIAAPSIPAFIAMLPAIEWPPE